MYCRCDRDHNLGFVFSPRYKGAKEILHTLRDDLKPGATFLGHLDLTGATLKTKVARETKDTRNRTTFSSPEGDILTWEKMDVLTLG